VLVVVLIIGIISSVVLISLNVVGDDRDLRREARRVASLVETIADEAELQGRDFGIEFMRGGYRFVEYDPFFDTWAEVAADNLLRPRSLPEDFQLALVIEEKRIELEERAADTGPAKPDDDDDDDDRNQSRTALLDKYAPHAMILSSGDVSPFNLTVIRQSDDATAIVRVLPTGEIELQEQADDLG